MLNRIAYIRAGCIYNDSRAQKEIEALLGGNYYVYILNWDRDGKDVLETSKLFSKYKNYEQHTFRYNAENGIGLRNISILVRWIKWVYSQISNLNRIDIIHACNLDAAIGVYTYVKKTNCKFVYDIFDYYVDSHSIPKIIRKLVEKIEIKIIELANITIICTEERKIQIEKAKPNKVLVVYNSPEIDHSIICSEIYDY